MKRVFQNKFAEKEGNCFAACIASILEVPFEHISVATDDRGVIRDDIGRPKIVMRKHDFEFGWFTAVAARHGAHSMERQQAQEILCQAGQFYWPGIAPAK
jgi:hypothetical protein